MTTTVAVGPTPMERRARVAVSALFLTNGALYANLVPRFPGIKQDLALSNTAYGLTIIVVPAAALVAALTAAPLLRRFGSARAAVAGTVVTAGALAVAGLSSSWAGLVAALAVAGAADAITDVGQNAHGLRVQRRYGRSINNSFHALWSVGAVLGGGMGAAALALELSRGTHLIIAAGLFSAVALTALRFCLPGPERDEASDEPLASQDAVSRRRGAAWVLSSAGSKTGALAAALMAIAGASVLVEDTGGTWAAVYLSGSLGAPAAVAALGFVAMVGAQTLTRLVADRLVDAYGQRAVARAGALVVAFGMGLALAVPTVPGTIAGFAAAGAGVATLVPAAMQQADELPGLRPGTGVTLVSWLMRLGYLASPPVVGVVADSVGLRVGLLVAPLSGLVLIVLAGALPGRRSVPRD